MFECSIILSLLLIAGLILFILWLSLRPHRPQFYLNSFTPKCSMAEMLELFEAANNGNTNYLHQYRDIKLLTTRNAQGDTACHVAIREGHIRFASLIAAFHPPTILCEANAEGDPVPHYALKMGQLSELIKQVRSHLGYNVNSITSLWRHLGYNASSITSLWLCLHVLVNRDGKSLLYMAVEDGDIKVVGALTELLAAAGINFPIADELALYVAIRNRNYDMCSLTQVLQPYFQESPSCQEGKGRTPLHMAVVLNDLKMVQLIINNSLSNFSYYTTLKFMDVRNHDGFSALHLAASMNHLEIFRLLLRHCPDGYLTNTKHYLANTIGNQNVLHLAVQAKAAKIVKFIVNDKKMAKDLINQQDNGGNTPLDIAASDDNKKIMNILLATSFQMQEGCTFLDMVIEITEHALSSARERPTYLF